ncbi:hypothetical protein DWQ65_07205 [Treponema phagedenis]|nr:hypothetical protein DWQ65_07205 [Treponema phagedenis]
MAKSEPPRVPVFPSRIEFEIPHLYNRVFKLTGLVLTWTAKLRTATDGGGSKQQRCFKARQFAKL